MAIYNLEESSDTFITPTHYNNKFVYDIEHIPAEDTKKTTRAIDLRSDKLVIYGTEIKENMFQKLYESLILRPTRGYVCVNCNGSCYIYIAGKGYRPIDNVIFDWSPFGVIVPNSINDSLQKQVEEKEKAVENLMKQCESARAELESSRASLKASNDEVNELKTAQNEMGLKMQKVYEKVALVDFELELYKIELESCKKESDEVLNEVCNCKEAKRTMEVEMHDRFASEVSSYEMNTKRLEDELSLVRSELNSTKDQRERLGKNVQEIEDRLSSLKNEYRDMEDELKKVRDQVCLEIKEAQHILGVELRKTHEQHLSEIHSVNEINRELELKSKSLEDELSFVRSELRSTKELLHESAKELEERLSSSENRARDMKEELVKVHDQLNMANKETKCNMNLLESSRKEVEDLKEEIGCYEKEQECMEIQLRKLSKNIKSINLEVKTSNQKLDQVLISRLWNNGSDHSHQNVQFSCIAFPPPTFVIVAREIQIQ